MGQIIAANPRAAARIKDSQGLSSGAPGRQRARAEGERRINTPSPVVSRRRSVLERVTRIGKTVVEGAHHGSGGIGGDLGHQLEGRKAA